MFFYLYLSVYEKLRGKNNRDKHLSRIHLPVRSFFNQAEGFLIGRFTQALFYFQIDRASFFIDMEFNNDCSAHSFAKGILRMDKFLFQIFAISFFTNYRLLPALAVESELEMERTGGRYYVQPFVSEEFPVDSGVYGR